ncbi:MAG: 50S ribosomal protein L25 [Candidatus Shikimatogenerans bostrichidophilus]|nr:MAG: 50S ribosomal protein L25 [Candidatus Shikimatogenerans bostrichidophilus]
MHNKLNIIVKKRTINKINKKENIPCIIYNKKFNLPCYIPLVEVKKIIKKKKYIINVSINTKKKIVCLVKDIQYNILKNKILHIDFYKIEKKKPFKCYVNVKIKGNSIGISKGAICNIPLKKIKIETTLDNYIKEFYIDITNLDIGDKIYIKDIKINNVKILHPYNQIVVSIKIKKVNKED